MIPSEDDLFMENRLEEENDEFEGIRKKRKKKQVATPRPACSWVHFSREFIKEYSASHPGSSGLKNATKAASDAWKLLSPDEKAKYTTRSRDMWDKYFSSTPARSPKPRRQTKLVTRCSPGRLLNVVQRLTPEQKAAVKSMGFGSILGLRCRTLRRSLCLWLLERFNTVRRSLEVCDERIPLTPKDVELVMGLPACGKDVVNSGPDDSILELRQKYSASNRGISVRLLEERLASPDAGEDFRRSFVLYVLGTLLCPSARLDVSPSFLHFLTNMDVIHQYNWGKFLLDRLVREVARYRQGKQRAVGGCLLFLQLFYYESVALKELQELAPVSFPCLYSWGEEEISEREKQEKELGGYGSGEVICKERGLGMGLLGYKSQLNVTPVGVPASLVEYSPPNLQEEMVEKDHFIGDMDMEEENALVSTNEEAVLCGEIRVIDESISGPCGNVDFGCNECVDCINRDAHEPACLYSPCVCPLDNCDFIGSSKQLMLHFSSKHWDSGGRVQYDCPLGVSLGKDDSFLVLQAEEDGTLFLVNKGTESIGYALTITCIGSSSSREQYFYDLSAERGGSCLRLKSFTLNYPARFEGLPQTDFLLVPFTYLNTSGQLELEVCIWNSVDPCDE